MGIGIHRVSERTLCALSADSWESTTVIVTNSFKNLKIRSLSLINSMESMQTMKRRTSTHLAIDLVLSATLASDGSAETDFRHVLLLQERNGRDEFVSVCMRMSWWVVGVNDRVEWMLWHTSTRVWFHVSRTTHLQHCCDRSPGSLNMLRAS